MPRTQTPPTHVTLRLSGHSFPVALAAFVAASDLGTGSSFWEEYRTIDAQNPIHTWNELVIAAAAALMAAEATIDLDRDYVTGLTFKITDERRTAEWGTGRTRVRLTEDATGRWFVMIRLEDETGNVAWWKNPVQSLAARVAAGLGLSSPEEIETPLRHDILMAAAAYERRMVAEWAQEDRYGSYKPTCSSRWEDNFHHEETVAANDAGVEWFGPKPAQSERLEEEA